MCAVEWKKLGDVCYVHTGEQLNRNDMSDDGKYPVINGGKEPSGYTNSFNERPNSITISQGGESAGYVNWIDKEFWAGAHCYVVEHDEKVVRRFLYHSLKNIELLLQSIKQGAGIPGLNRKRLYDQIIPIPSPSKQQEIVSQLDTFTTLISNLESELDMRRKQYEHYRNQLLDFEGVEKLPLSEIFEMRGGYTPSTNNNDYWEGGIYPWFRMEDIRENGYILNDSDLHITPAAVKKSGLFPMNTIILATSATIGVHALLTVPALSNQRFTAFYPKEKHEDKINCKFTYYVFFLVDEWCKNNTVQGGFASVDMVGLKRYLFPIPSLKTQQEIVEKLDAFEHLIQSLETEIKLRKQQYEYYREKLLTFE